MKLCRRCIGLLAGAEESELLRGSASAPGHIIVLCSWTKILHSLSKQEFKSALEEMSGKHDNWYWSKVGGEVVITLVIIFIITFVIIHNNPSCYRNQNKILLDGPFGLRAEITIVYWCNRIIHIKRCGLDVMTLLPPEIWIGFMAQEHFVFV